MEGFPLKDRKISPASRKDKLRNGKAWVGIRQEEWSKSVPTFAVDVTVDFSAGMVKKGDGFGQDAAQQRMMAACD